MLSKVTTHKFDFLAKIFLKLFEKIEYTEFIKEFLPKLLGDKYLNLNAVNFLAAIVEKYSKAKSAETYHQALENALILWHDQNFIKKASTLHLKCNFLNISQYSFD